MVSEASYGSLFPLPQRPGSRLKLGVVRTHGMRKPTLPLGSPLPGVGRSIKAVGRKSGAKREGSGLVSCFFPDIRKGLGEWLWEAPASDGPFLDPSVFICVHRWLMKSWNHGRTWTNTDKQGNESPGGRCRVSSWWYFSRILLKCSILLSISPLHQFSHTS